MAEYRTKDLDMLDAICYAYYGYENAVTDVLAVNPGLVDQGPVLNAGILIELPELQKSSINTVKLWD